MSIEAMKQALEALECLFGIPEQFTGKGGGDVAVWTLGGSYRAQQAIPVLRQAIEQAEKQEPVGHADLEINNIYLFNDQEQRVIPEGRQPLYTHPPKREWRWLTDEEIALVCAECAASAHNWNDISFARAIEAKLKEKNGLS